MDSFAMINKDIIRPMGLLAVLAGLSTAAPAQQDSEAMQVVADAVRSQGYACAEPSAVERDPTLSRPDLPVWILTCEGGRYRVELVPDMRARVTPVN
jgi:hypothetical protein